VKISRPLLVVPLLLLGSAAAASAQTQWTASLFGASEVPAASTGGSGTFDATLSADQSTMTFTLVFQNLQGTTAQAAIRRGAVGVNGAVVYYLANSTFSSPLTGQTDPAPAGGPTGFNASDFSDLQSGNLYVEVRTTTFPNGEIRGQLVSAVVANKGTWAKIKALFH
jgi:hypothetical protein